RAAGRPAGAARAAPEGARAAEEGLEDVVDPAGREAERVAGAGDALGPEAVVARPLLRVGQHLVGLGHGLEALGRVGVGVGVGVELAGELAEGPLDLLGAGVP